MNSTLTLCVKIENFKLLVLLILIVLHEIYLFLEGAGIKFKTGFLSKFVTSFTLSLLYCCDEELLQWRKRFTLEAFSRTFKSEGQ